MGSNDALATIKAQLECQVEELAAQLTFKEQKIGEYKNVCDKLSTKFKCWQSEGKQTDFTKMNKSEMTDFIDSDICNEIFRIVDG